MNTLINFAKENFQLINLLVGVLGVLIAFIAVVYELKARKRKKESIPLKNNRNRRDINQKK